MLTEAQLNIISEKLVPLYADLEMWTIKDITRRLQKTGRWTETAELQAQALQRQGFSPARIQAEVMKTLQRDPAFWKEVGENTIAHKQAMAKKYAALSRDIEHELDDICTKSVGLAFRQDLALWAQAGRSLVAPSSLAQLQEAFYRQTLGELQNLTRSTGFKLPTGWAMEAQAYQKSLDFALIKVTSGAATYQTAIRDACHALSKSGLRGVTYYDSEGNPKLTNHVDVAVRRALLTGSAQVAARITEANMDSTGVDLVEVSSHWGARPEHAAWQGGIYSRSGKHKRYKGLVAATGYGTVDGLAGWNCRHLMFPFFEGFSQPQKWAPEPPPIKYKDKKLSYYDCTQVQRGMEREIRAYWREYEAMPSDDLKGEMDAKYNEYMKFSRTANIRPKLERTYPEYKTKVAHMFKQLAAN